jgi:hypothetical protein
MALVIRNFGIVCVLCHCKGAEPELQTKKPFRSGRKDFGIGSHLACADARYPFPPDLLRSGRDIRAMADKIKDDMIPVWQCALLGAIAFWIIHVGIWPKAAELARRDRSAAVWGTPDVLQT